MPILRYEILQDEGDTLLVRGAYRQAGRVFEFKTIHDREVVASDLSQVLPLFFGQVYTAAWGEHDARR